MARIRIIQTAFNAGQLDERLEPREDLKAYYQGARRAVNVEFLPQGGFKRRAGTSDFGAARRILEEVDATSAVVTRLSGAATPPPPGEPGPPPPPDPPPELPPGFENFQWEFDIR